MYLQIEDQQPSENLPPRHKNSQQYPDGDQNKHNNQHQNSLSQTSEFAERRTLYSLELDKTVELTDFERIPQFSLLSQDILSQRRFSKNHFGGKFEEDLYENDDLFVKNEEKFSPNTLYLASKKRLNLLVKPHASYPVKNSLKSERFCSNLQRSFNSTLSKYRDVDDRINVVFDENQRYVTDVDKLVSTESTNSESVNESKISFMKSSRTLESFDSNRNLSFDERSEDNFPFQRKLDSPRSLSERRRPFFYLPVDEDDTASTATFGDDQSLIFNNNDELLNDPDLYPFPKTGSIFSTQSSPTALKSPQHIEKDEFVEGQTLPRRVSKSKSHRDCRITSHRDDPEIKKRIQQCLDRARSRRTSLSGVGSFEAGLYRLEGLLEETETQKITFGERSKPFRSLDNVPLSKLMNKQFRDVSTITGKLSLICLSIYM